MKDATGPIEAESFERDSDRELVELYFYSRHNPRTEVVQEHA